MNDVIVKVGYGIFQHFSESSNRLLTLRHSFYVFKSFYPVIKAKSCSKLLFLVSVIAAVAIKFLFINFILVTNTKFKNFYLKN